MSRKLFFFLFALLPSLAGSSVYFDGDDRFDCSKQPTLEKYFTLSAQIKIYNDNEETQVIISRGTDALGTPVYEMRIALDPDSGSGFTVYCEFTDAGGTVQTVYADCAATGDCMQLGTPYHIGCVLDQRGDLTPWINGVPYTTLATGSATIPEDSIVYLGMDHYLANPARDTEISDATIWYTDLNNSQMQSLGFSFMRSNIVDTTYRAGYWPLDDLDNNTNVGTTPMTDRSGGGSPCIAASSSEGGTLYADWVRYK